MNGLFANPPPSQSLYCFSFALTRSTCNMLQAGCFRGAQASTLISRSSSPDRRITNTSKAREFGAAWSLRLVASPHPNERIGKGLFEDLAITVLCRPTEYETVVIALSFEGRGRALVGHHPVVISFFRIFGAVVVLTMLAAHSFDPRLIWDHAVKAR